MICTRCRGRRVIKQGNSIKSCPTCDGTGQADDPRLRHPSSHRQQPPTRRRPPHQRRNPE